MQTEAAILAGLRIAPFLFQSAIGGPKRGWFISQLCARSDDLAKQNAASRRSGTVGSPGRGMPRMPRPRL